MGSSFYGNLLVPSLLGEYMADHIGHAPLGKLNSKLFQMYKEMHAASSHNPLFFGNHNFKIIS